MDTITLYDITVQALIGILPEEQTKRQRLCVTVELGLPLNKPGRTDKIEHTVNYADIESTVLKIAENSHFNLIEKFADEVASQVLAQPHILQVSVKVSKPDILQHTANVAVSIQRSK